MSDVFSLIESLSLTTPRLTISPIEDNDLKSVYDMHCIDEVNKYIPYSTWKSWQDAENWLAMIHQRRTDKEAQCFALKSREDASLIGTSLVFNMNKRPEKLSFGYVLSPKHWRKAYASEATDAIVKAVMGFPSILELNAIVQVGNVASLAILRKLGFVELGADTDDEGLAIQRFKLTKAKPNSLT